MQEEAARREESFSIELDAANRLTELTRNSANTERQRQQDLSAQLEAAKDEASEQLGRLSAELETEHTEREAAEAKIAELEVLTEQLQADLSAMQQAQKSHSSHQGTNGYMTGTPMRGASTPLGSPSTARSKTGLSVTQMYSNYNDIKLELETERRRNEKLTSTIDEMIQDLETRQPEIEELRSDHARLESEITEMSSLIDVITKERDQAIKAAKKWEGQIEAKAIEGEVLRQQLRDLSSQVKVLLMEVHLRDEGLDDIGAEERGQLDRLAHGQIDEEAMEGSTATAKYISANLVTFRNINELQEQNTNLLKITREIGERMEHEEAVRKQLEDTRNWDDLQQKYERCKDEVKSLMTQSQSYIRERDMFRRMLSHRGQLPPGSDVSSLFGASGHGDAAPTTPRPAGIVNSIEDSPTAKDLVEYAKLYKDMQTHFDAYKHEAATDRSTLKEQVDSLSRQNGELRSEVARSNSQVTLAHERYEMLNANYTMLKNENSVLQRRSQYSSENASKLEMRVQQVAEDLVEAKGIIDSMRNETANLKAEKEFWKTIEKRLSEDNENLLNERSRLNALSANLQNILNEREHSDTEARRRLQVQVDNLEKELHNTKAKLSEATEENKRLAQRREYDHEQSQRRIDDLVSSLGSVRESLVAANTAKDHLSARVDQLTIELRSAEERANVLQPTPTPRANNSNNNEAQQQSTDDDGSGLSKEQELTVEVSELKRDLDLSKTELENVKGQVEQYKAISQASEEELNSLNETQELYRQETDKLIEEKNLKINELEQRVEDVLSELAATNTELTDLRNQQAENDRRLEEQKKAYEAEIAQLKDQDDRHAATAQYYQEDLRAQAEIAQQAQQNYESELIKHGDAAKALQKVRADHNDLKLKILQVKAEAESARISLTQSEESWAESRERYERELAELKVHRENLTAQNNRLHQQLESVTAQISNLSKRASTGDEDPVGEAPALNFDNLQEVIKYLRREKEIVDVQLELSTQEGKRLKQQLDYTQSQLDDTRLRLNQQMRMEADSQRTSLEHNQLMETINELNTFRESSVTLRAETRQAQAALVARTKEVEELTAQIEPLKAEILELRNKCETQEGEMRLLRENSDRWQQRAQNVLQKYERVDPAELEALKEQVKALESERDELLLSKQSLQEQADNAATQISQAQDQNNEKIETLRARLTDQFKTRSKDLSNKIKEKDSALKDLEQQLAGLSDVQQQLIAARAERDAAVEKAGTQSALGQNARDGSEDGQVNESDISRPTQADLQVVQDNLAAAEARAAGEASQAASLRTQLDASRSRIAELEVQIVGSLKIFHVLQMLIIKQGQLQESLNASKAELAQLQTAQQQQANPIISDEAEEHIKKLREDLAKAHQDAENLRTAASVHTALTNASAEDGSKPIADQVAEHVEAVRAELEARHNERVKQVDETLEKRTNAMKANLTKRLTEGKNQIRQSLAAEHEQALQALRTEHEQEIERLRARHTDELEELRRNEESKFSKLREAWEKEHQTAQAVNGQPGLKTEGETPPRSWQPTEAEAKTLVQSSEVVRGVLRKNVTTQVNKLKEEISAQLKEEHEKVLAERIAEIQTKSNTAKDHAVLMEGKKNALQVNMATNKMRIAQFKIDLVQKAAQETPQKPVGEVWIAIKDAKPPTNVASPPPQDASKAPTTMIGGHPNPFASNATQSTPGPANHQGQSNPFAQVLPQQKQAQAKQQGQPLGVSTFGRPTPAAPVVQGSSPAEQHSPPPNATMTKQQPNAANENQQFPQQEPIPPPKPSQGNSNINTNAGTGPSALRGLQQSGLPVARGGSSVRGTTRGRGSGRGGPQALNTGGGPGQQQGRGSPTNNNFNPSARQFVPGSKRPREDTQDAMHGGEGGNGKRIRGGGGGS